MKPGKLAKWEADLTDLLEELTGLSIATSQKGRSPEVGVDLVLAGDGHRFHIEYRSSGQASQVALAANRLREVLPKAAISGAVPLVVVPFMGDVGKRICQEQQVSWVDLSGNANISGAGLRVLVEGKANRFKRPGRPNTAFAAKASRIVRVLLENRTDPLRQKELAHEAGVSEGYVSQVVRKLLRDDLVSRDDKGFVLVSKPGFLLDAWREAYDFQKHHVVRGHMSARSGEQVTRKLGDFLKRRGVRHAVTGLAGAWLLAPFAGFRVVTAFVEERRQIGLLEELGFREEDRGSNLWVAVPEDESVFRNSREVQDICCASPIQVYLDLKGQPERSQEAAAHLRTERLSWAVDG